MITSVSSMTRIRSYLLCLIQDARLRNHSAELDLANENSAALTSKNKKLEWCSMLEYFLIRIFFIAIIFSALLWQYYITTQNRKQLASCHCIRCQPKTSKQSCLIALNHYLNAAKEDKNNRSKVIRENWSHTACIGLWCSTFDRQKIPVRYDKNKQETMG